MKYKSISYFLVLFFGSLGLLYTYRIHKDIFWKYLIIAISSGIIVAVFDIPESLFIIGVVIKILIMVKIHETEGSRYIY